MVLYRITKKKYADDLSGYGAKITGGRWNRKDIPALYLAESQSLTILETIVHCHDINDLNNRLILFIEVPDNLTNILDQSILPEDWNKKPWHNFTVNFGSEWLISNKNLLLKLPSAVVPDENIFMINPKYSEVSKIKTTIRKIFKPDHRLVLLQ